MVLAGCTCTGPDRGPDRRGDGAPPDSSDVAGDTASTGDTTGTVPLAWVMADVGADESCGLLTDQRLVCWGLDERVAQAPSGPFSAVDLGTGTGGCALDDAGAMHCWCYEGTDADGICRHTPEGTGWLKVLNGG